MGVGERFLESTRENYVLAFVLQWDKMQRNPAQEQQVGRKRDYLYYHHFISSLYFNKSQVLPEKRWEQAPGSLAPLAWLHGPTFCWCLLSREKPLSFRKLEEDNLLSTAVQWGSIIYSIIGSVAYLEKYRFIKWKISRKNPQLFEYKFAI